MDLNKRAEILHRLKNSPHTWADLVALGYHKSLLSSTLLDSTVTTYSSVKLYWVGRLPATIEYFHIAVALAVATGNKERIKKTLLRLLEILEEEN